MLHAFVGFDVMVLTSKEYIGRQKATHLTWKFIYIYDKRILLQLVPVMCCEREIERCVDWLVNRGQHEDWAGGPQSLREH